MSGQMQTLRQDRRLTQGKLPVLVGIRCRHTGDNRDRIMVWIALVDATPRARHQDTQHA